MPRLFTALELPPDVVAMLAGLRGGLPGARWADPDDYHITLRFFGDVSRRIAQDLADELADSRAMPLNVTITGLDAFGGARPHAVIASVDSSRMLTDLQAEHERLARRVGLPPERRRFTPHVTLARLRAANVLDVADYLSIRGGFPALSFTPTRFVLFSARDQIGGGPYVVEADFPLAEAVSAVPSVWRRQGGSSRR